MVHLQQKIYDLIKYIKNIKNNVNNITFAYNYDTIRIYEEINEENKKTKTIVIISETNGDIFYKYTDKKSIANIFNQNSYNNIKI
jgi:hypothetical protein